MGLPFSFHGGGTFKDDAQVASKVNTMPSPYFVCFLVFKYLEGCDVPNHNMHTYILSILGYLFTYQLLYRTVFCFPVQCTVQMLQQPQSV